MPGGVIEVRRSERLSLLERLWLPGFLLGLWIAGRRFFRGRQDAARDPRLLQPYQRPAFIRGMPTLVTDGGRPRCVGCGLCEEICPARCIRVEAGAEQGTLEADEDPVPTSPATGIDRFEIDMGRCFQCGLCEEVCPADALVMSPLVEIAASDPGSLIFDMDALLVPAALLKGRLRDDDR